MLMNTWTLRAILKSLPCKNHQLYYVSIDMLKVTRVVEFNWFICNPLHRSFNFFEIIHPLRLVMVGLCRSSWVPFIIGIPIGLTLMLGGQNPTLLRFNTWSSEYRTSAQFQQFIWLLILRTSPFDSWIFRYSLVTLVSLVFLPPFVVHSPGWFRGFGWQDDGATGCQYLCRLPRQLLQLIVRPGTMTETTWAARRAGRGKMGIFCIKHLGIYTHTHTHTHTHIYIYKYIKLYTVYTYNYANTIMHICVYISQKSETLFMPSLDAALTQKQDILKIGFHTPDTWHLSGRTETWKGPGMVCRGLVLCGSLQLWIGRACHQDPWGWWIYATCQLSRTWPVVFLQNLWWQGGCCRNSWDAMGVFARLMCIACEPSGVKQELGGSIHINTTSSKNSAKLAPFRKDPKKACGVFFRSIFFGGSFWRKSTTENHHFLGGLLDDTREEGGAPGRAQELQQEGGFPEMRAWGHLCGWMIPSWRWNLEKCIYIYIFFFEIRNRYVILILLDPGFLNIQLFFSLKSRGLNVSSGSGF